MGRKQMTIQAVDAVKHFNRMANLGEGVLRDWMALFLDMEDAKITTFTRTSYHKAVMACWKKYLADKEKK